MNAYTEKFKDPRWQRKRLEIMKRDDFTCCYCGEKNKTLNVHHTFYKKNKDPWDYPDYSLLTLCSECHLEEHEMKKSNISDIKLLANDFHTSEDAAGFADFMRDFLLTSYQTKLAILDFFRYKNEYIATWEKCIKRRGKKNAGK